MMLDYLDSLETAIFQMEFSMFYSRVGATE